MRFESIWSLKVSATETIKWVFESIRPVKVPKTEEMKGVLIQQSIKGSENEPEFESILYVKVPRTMKIKDVLISLICKIIRNRHNEMGTESIWTQKVPTSEAMKWLFESIWSVKVRRTMKMNSAEIDGALKVARRI